MQINWEDKISNMQAIADELNIGIDSLVFIDDDKLNREMIRKLKEANKRRVFPKEVDKPPESWEVIKEIGKDDKNKITIYYAA